MGGFDILNLLAITITPFVSIAASNTPAVISTNSGQSQYALAQVADANFSTDPRASQVKNLNETAPVELFVLTQGLKEDGSISYVITIRNTKKSVAKNLALGVTHPSSMVYTKSDPKIDTSIQKGDKTELMFFLPNLAPGGHLENTIQFTGTGDPNLGVQLSFTYAGTQRVATTTYIQPQVLQATDEGSLTGPLPTVPPPSGGERERNPQPAIICDPNIPNGCTEIIPNLGINFQKVRELDSRPVICSSTDPLDCEDKKPELGERFREAVAVTEPGECRVGEDARIKEPAFHDSFLRQRLPAAFYMEPLFNSGQDFKALVFEGIIEGIKYNANKRRELIGIWVQMFSEHNDIIDSVLEDEMSGGEAIGRLDNLIIRLANQLRGAQGSPEDPYKLMVQTVIDGYDEVAEKAVENTTTSILRACQELNGEPEALQERLEIIRVENLEPLLENLQNRYPDGNIPTMSQLTELRAFWNQTLYPALRAWDSGDLGRLKAVNKSYTMDIFDISFRNIYITHYNFAEEDLEAFRLNNWEIELDTPKTKATECEFEEKVVKVIDSVEETECEVQTVAEELVRDGLGTLKGQLGALQPPQVEGSDNEQGLPGLACGGNPGDPYWASGCECKCGDVVGVEEDGTLILCGELFDITRHDIFITTQDECLKDPHDNGHFSIAEEGEEE